MWWMPGPHLKRRIERESGSVVGHTRQSTTFFASSSAVEEFKKVLISKYGTLTRAWRVGMDVDENGMLDMREFINALHDLGYIGNIRTLWYLLDEDHSGFISLRELDPSSAMALEKFRAISTAKYKSIPEMWKTCMDRDRSNSVPLSEFVEGCITLGYEDELEVVNLFNIMLVKPGSRFITLDDIMFLQNWEIQKRKQAEKSRFIRSWVNKDPYLRGAPVLPERLQTASSQGYAASDEPDYSGQVGIDWEEEKDKFRKFLIKRYGSLCQAFEAMDANGSGSLSLVEFQAIVASVLRYCRNAEAARLFREFNGGEDDDDSATISWQELGISRVEWTTYRMQQSLKRQMRAREQFLNVTMPVGTSPRAKKAERKYMERHRDKKKVEARWAFNSPLPEGWGAPPSFVPSEPPHRRRLPDVSNSARF